MTHEEWLKLDNGEKAWLLGQIMIYMNDEEAYYSDWLYIWPDGETWEQCMEDFESDESYKDLEQSVIEHYSDKETHDAGLYSHEKVPLIVVNAAHYWDKRLGLELIEVVK